jgi:ribA/ribD-fused uncharacterized protein
LKNTKIILKEDFPQEILQKRNQLLPIMYQAKKLKMKAHLKEDTLIINNESYTVESLHNLPEALNPIHFSSRQSNDIIAFFSASNPLSNFFGAPFTLEGKVFFSVEQYYQYSKAVKCGNPIAANKILKSSSSSFCKRIGDSLTSPDWKAQSLPIMFHGCKAKFSQNEIPRRFLLDSGNKIIAEASKNATFGIGLNLEDPEVLNRSKWTGNNELGKILMRIRQELSNA